MLWWIEWFYCWHKYGKQGHSWNIKAVPYSCSELTIEVRWFIDGYWAFERHLQRSRSIFRNIPAKLLLFILSLEVTSLKSKIEKRFFFRIEGGLSNQASVPFATILTTATFVLTFLRYLLQHYLAHIVWLYWSFFLLWEIFPFESLCCWTKQCVPQSATLRKVSY